eukprot:GHVP01010900.1.p1 GENE.GHVP01010900.1~~GHVP01010900.1.p1  ORF type:complete len:1359 (-),score=252.74 GHVP01010900.1:49-4125(-)
MPKRTSRLRFNVVPDEETSKEKITAQFLENAASLLQKARSFSDDNQGRRFMEFAKNEEETSVSVPTQRSTGYGSKNLELTRQSIHLQSADLFDNFSPFQKTRQLWKPTLPDVFQDKGSFDLIADDCVEEAARRRSEKIVDMFPKISEPQYAEFHKSAEKAKPTKISFRAAIVLSGGPAPGGHNVIAGLYDFVKRHREGKLFGIMGGLDGLFQMKYREITNEMMDRFRNQGGFDMLWSGRARLESADDYLKARTAAHNLHLDALVIVGGDGSNSNAALLAEDFQMHGLRCCVVGVPKTIDGDLANEFIEVSFGFDTAAKTYSELIGNLCVDASTLQRMYHVVRVMGRSASHLTLECAFQTRPNIVLIGEEIKQQRKGLKDIITEICNVIQEREKKEIGYGVILLPEGLIEFIPEFETLVQELSTVAEGTHVDEAKLTEESRNAWQQLPQHFQEQFLLDRESTGYIQVAKIQTEKLIIGMILKELTDRGAKPNPKRFMGHYFGYEGRCAMPSNFDCNYCYTLGYTAGAIAANKVNGTMAVVRHLDQHPSLWQPCSLPFVDIMMMFNNSYPAIKKALVDTGGPLFRLLRKARDFWKLDNYYRSPGPIQFEGSSSDHSNNTVSMPKLEDLITRKGEQKVGEKRANFPQYRSAVSVLNNERLEQIPQLPPLCLDPKAICCPANQVLPKDPFTQRQTLKVYPKMSNDSHFVMREVRSDETPFPLHEIRDFRVGLVFLSRQAPGMENVLWGLYNRVSKIQHGKLIGFYGLQGLMDLKYLDVCESDLDLILNQGGSRLLGRSTDHSLLDSDNHEPCLRACQQLKLSGLVIVGSSIAILESAFLAEYFLNQNCGTRIIGIPATTSNNLVSEHFETCIGFDSSSKIYANLVGNVLTEAASMPKYWHFIRLMGRSPSHEVLECALQTHPNVAIIAEEYGAADKTLNDVIQDIADVVCRRAEMGKNFGTVLIPDGLLTHLPGTKSMLNEIQEALREAKSDEEREAKRNAMLGDEDTGIISGWSWALFKSLPLFIQSEFTLIMNSGSLNSSYIDTEILIKELVAQELEDRKAAGFYVGKFQSVTHFFGYQGRSSLPSTFDSKLGFAYGHLASICVESGLTGYCCSVRGLCGDTNQWKLMAVPFVCMMSIAPSAQEIDPELLKTRIDGQKSRLSERPVIPPALVNLHCKAFRWMKTAIEQWELQDRFCNPGPIQFEGPPTDFYHRTLHEEQSEYFQIIQRAREYADLLKETLTFGIDSFFAKTVFVQLNSLLTMRLYPEDLLNHVTPITELDKKAVVLPEQPVITRRNSGANLSSSKLMRMETSAVDLRPDHRLPNRFSSFSTFTARFEDSSGGIESGWGEGRGVEEYPNRN